MGWNSYGNSCSRAQYSSIRGSPTDDEAFDLIVIARNLRNYLTNLPRSVWCSMPAITLICRGTRIYLLLYISLKHALNILRTKRNGWNRLRNIRKTPQSEVRHILAILFAHCEIWRTFVTCTMAWYARGYCYFQGPFACCKAFEMQFDNHYFV